MDKKECGCAEGKCACGSMGHMHGCHGGMYHLLKVVLKIFILIIIFWCGFQLGQESGLIKAEYGRAMMMSQRGGASNFGMMGGNSGWNNNTSGVMIPATNATPVVPTPAK
ncbi:MAG: hypothetical protein P4L63_01345 [Candidatus Pacebacteria bacterium]|nr:hypothetical protein [Candidatus Paceibacterota bacterium]